MHSTDLKKPLLILMLGAPGAGKTFFASQLASELHLVHLSGERIRYELFDKPKFDDQENEIILRLLDYMTEVSLQAGTGVVYDDLALGAYNARLQRRTMASQFDTKPLTVWVQTDNTTAFKRASNRDRRRTHDKYVPSLTKAIFDRLVGAIDQPQYREEFVVISGKYPFKNQLAAVRKKLEAMSASPTTTPKNADDKTPSPPTIRPLSSPRRTMPSRQIRIR